MDQLTHALTGYFVSRITPHRERIPHVGAWGIGLANLPDVDSVARLVGDTLTYLTWHRTLTHALSGWLVLPLVSLLMPVRWRGPTRVWLPFVYLQWGLHIVLDLTTVYPTFLFWPFSWEAVVGAWQFILAPFLWIVGGLALGIVVCRRSLATPASVAFLGIEALFFLHAGWSHLQARHHLVEWLRTHRPDIRAETVQLLPLPWSHTRWVALVATQERLLRFYRPGPTASWEPLRAFDRTGCLDLIRLASRNASVHRYFRFARWWACVPMGDPRGYIFFDARFALGDVPASLPHRLRHRIPFALVVTRDPQNQSLTLHYRGIYTLPEADNHAEGHRSGL